MDQQAKPASLSAADVTLEKLVTLIEKASQAIDRLQYENAQLHAQLQQREAQAAAATAQMQASALRVRELEAAHERLAADAHWCRWFRGKYADSTFYGHIETAYRVDFPAPDAESANTAANTEGSEAA
ncbi:hypothetical protein E4K72_13255 [Oxalobacteraceae bacterium OM1]|nr:hypothetical protein E4K72_13255 [Oxalobacteraceae bacterium OM1]